jgi:hypothetical protein
MRVAAVSTAAAERVARTATEGEMRNSGFALLLMAGIVGCSASNAEVETGPDPQTQTIPGMSSDQGSEPEMKNEDVPENASTAAKFGIPPGHLPPPGQCKVWMPGEPPGKQKKKHAAGDCTVVSADVPAGGWLVYRPGDDKKEVVVREYDSARQITSVRVFDIVTGALVREVDPDDG